MGNGLSSLYTIEVMKWYSGMPLNIRGKVENLGDLKIKAREDLGIFVEVEEVKINPNYSEFVLPESHGKQKIGYRHKENYFLGRPDIKESEEVMGLEILCEECRGRLAVVPLRSEDR